MHFIICIQQLKEITNIIEGGAMDIKHIGENISKLRVARGLPQENLGKQIGLTPSAISNIEKQALEELHFKSKLLTAEMFLKSGEQQKSSYEIDNKKYFFEERQNEITYKVSEVDK